MVKRSASLIVLPVLLLTAMPAAAYVGPGAGLSMLGALWGLLAALGAALGFIVLWPLRRALKRKRASAQTSERAADGQAGSRPA